MNKRDWLLTKINVAKAEIAALPAFMDYERSMIIADLKEYEQRLWEIDIDMILNQPELMKRKLEENMTHCVPRSLNYMKAFNLLRMAVDYAARLDDGERKEFVREVGHFQFWLNEAVDTAEYHEWADKMHYWLKECELCHSLPMWFRSEDQKWYGVMCPNCDRHGPVTMIPAEQCAEEAANLWNAQTLKDILRKNPELRVEGER